MFGHDVIPRESVILEEARKSYLLFDQPLSEGYLSAFFVYIHGRNASVDAVYNRTNVSLYLQVWRGVPSEVLEYQLVYQKKVYVNASSPGGLLYAVRYT